MRHIRYTFYIMQALQGRSVQHDMVIAIGNGQRSSCADMALKKISQLRKADPDGFYYVKEVIDYTGGKPS